MFNKIAKPIKISVASGKGGTGKTSLAVNMAVSIDAEISLIDCDVEAPNASLFFRQSPMRREFFETGDESFFDTLENFSVNIPQFDEALCDGCGICKSTCKFNAITLILGKPLFFPELCHSCEACFSICPRQAISSVKKNIGKIREKEISGRLTLTDGILNVSEAKSPPLIKHMIKNRSRRQITLIDAPPGTSCPVVAAAYDADYVILVTEPTPFGLSDLKLAIDTMRQLERKFGIVINKYDGDFADIKEYCDKENIKIIGMVPFDMKIAQIYSRGGIVAEEMPHMRELFSKIFENAISEAIK